MTPPTEVRRATEEWQSEGTLDGRGEPEFRTMGERAFQLLRAAIVCGALNPGEPLPLDPLATATGMSRMPIREAIARLVHSGLVEMTPRYTARVSLLTPEDLRDLNDIRLQIEPPAIAAAAALFSEREFKVASRRLALLRTALERNDRGAAVQAHMEFHLALYRVALSRWQERTLCTVWNSSERYLQATGRPDETVSAQIDEHELLLTACRANGSKQAETNLRDHLLRCVYRAS